MPEIASTQSASHVHLGVLGDDPSFAEYEDSPLHDAARKRRLDRATLWVANRYITQGVLTRAPGRSLFGTSVHPDNPGWHSSAQVVHDSAAQVAAFRTAERPCPQQIRDALLFLATAPTRRPLPVLLDPGAEHATTTHTPAPTS